MVGIEFLILAAFLACAVVMVVAWRVALQKDFLSLVDAVWALGIGVVGVSYLAIYSGVFARALGVSVVLLVWSLRLGGHLVQRLRSHYPREDVRYVALKREWGAALGWKSLLFFQAQGALVVFFAYPFAVLALDESAFPRPGEWLGLGVVAVGVVGEGIADRQLRLFKKHATQRGLICDTGLWRYSRHPNYFFEWITWWGFSVATWGISGGMWSLLCPLLMGFLLLYVTGVKPAEEQMLASRGDAFRRYQATTSRFVPWFPRKPGGDSNKENK